MNKKEVDRELKKIIATYVAVNDISDINENTNLIEDLDMDSVGLISLIVEIEKNFSIHFEENELLVENITNYKNLLKYICESMETSYEKSTIN